MPEFLKLLSPDEARSVLYDRLALDHQEIEEIDTVRALGRILAESITAPHPLPEFKRSTVDGFALKAADTHGASESLPAFLQVVGEIGMGVAPGVGLAAGQCLLIHTGGMIPDGADAVLMLEHTQRLGGPERQIFPFEIEALRAVAVGENVIQVGEDVAQGETVIERGKRLRPEEIGGLLALGIDRLRVAKRIRVGIISSGDEVIPPTEAPSYGQVRDINSYTLSSLVEQSGAIAIRCGIVPDDDRALYLLSQRALEESDMVVITAGSSASSRDITASVIGRLGTPGVLVHGINTRPGKPTILGMCNGKPVIGLPGNPVSALVNGYVFVVPLVERMMGLVSDEIRPSVQARLSVNLSSQAGREDWWPVRLSELENKGSGVSEPLYLAEPIFGKSNLIFTLVAANGLICIPADATGLSAGDTVTVFLL